MSVTLVGQNMRYVDNKYIVVVTGSGVGRFNNKWKTHRPGWHLVLIIMLICVF